MQEKKKRSRVPIVGEWARGETITGRDPDSGQRFPSVCLCVRACLCVSLSPSLPL